MRRKAARTKHSTEYGGLEARIRAPNLGSQACIRNRSYTGFLRSRRAPVGARIVGAFERSVRVQQDRAGMPHRIRVGFAQHLDMVTGRAQLRDDALVEPRLDLEARMGRAPGLPQHAAWPLQGLRERHTVVDVPGEERRLDLRLGIAPPCAVTPYPPPPPHPPTPPHPI